MPEPTQLPVVVTEVDFPSKEEFVMLHLPDNTPIWINFSRVQNWYTDPATGTTVITMEQNNRLFVKENITL